MLAAVVGFAILLMMIVVCNLAKAIRLNAAYLSKNSVLGCCTYTSTSGGIATVLSCNILTPFFFCGGAPVFGGYGGSHTQHVRSRRIVLPIRRKLV
jgi:hypothetical protein